MSSISDYLGTIVLLSFLTYFSQKLACKRGFYKYPLLEEPKSPQIRGYQVFGYFGLYLFSFFFIAKLLLQKFSSLTSSSYAFSLALISSSLLCFFFSGFFGEVIRKERRFFKERTRFLTT